MMKSLQGKFLLLFMFALLLNLLRINLAYSSDNACAYEDEGGVFFEMTSTPLTAVLIRDVVD